MPRAGAASDSEDAALRKIDQFCDAVSNEKTTRHSLFALYASSPTAQAQWKAYKNEETLKADVGLDLVSKIADVWRAPNGRVEVGMAVDLALQGSTHLVGYCFRADGSLARLKSTVNSFQVKAPAGMDHPPEIAMRIRNRYFDLRGRETKVTSQVVDPKAAKPLPGVEVPDFPEDTFKTVGALPFSPLLRKQ